MSKIFAVIVTYNGSKCISKCLARLCEPKDAVELVVVDNASTDNTAQVARQAAPGAMHLCLSKNLGFGRANNIGIKHAYERGAEHLLLLNQDACIELNSVQGLVALQCEKPEFGILAPLHLDGSGAKLDTLFAYHLSKTRKMGTLLTDLLLGRNRRQIYETDFVNAAIWMLSRNCVERVGLFNPVFRHYGEDMEYADRVRHLGFKVGIVPGLSAIHDRPQNEADAPRNTPRHLLMEKALLRYRLSRIYPSTFKNILSAMSLVALGPYRHEDGLLTDLKIRAMLAAVIILETPGILQRRKMAYSGRRSFFREADSDTRTYLLASR